MHRVEDEKGNPTGIYKWVKQPVLQKLYKDSDKKWHFGFYGSSTRRDRDGDRFAKELFVNSWVPRINSGKMNLGSDHGHSWRDSLGALKRAEVRHNPHDGIDYMFVEAVLEDPDINGDVGLLIHKWELGEQISVSIAANPGETKWYDIEGPDKEGRTTRVIKSAELLKIDVVGEPANPDARGIDMVLKHDKSDSGKCNGNCSACYLERDFDACLQKSMIAPNTKIEQALSSLVNENANKNRMTLSKQDQDILNKEHECKEGETYCPDEGKCVPDSEMKSVNKDQADCPEGHKFNPETGKCEKEEMKSKLSPEVEKFIEQLKAIATQPAPEVGTNPNGTQGGDLEGIVARTLAAMRANPQMGQLQFNIPSAIEIAVPGQSGSSGVTGQTTAKPAATLQPPIPNAIVQATPGLSGAGPSAPAPMGAPRMVDLSNPAPIPPAHVVASKEPTIEKEHIRTVLLNKERSMAYIEKARKEVEPKQEAPGEISPALLDTTKFTDPNVKKAGIEYNKKVIELHAAQVRQQYTPADIAKMAEEGKLIAQLDQDKTFEKQVIPAYAKMGTEIKKRIGTVLLKAQ